MPYKDPEVRKAKQREYTAAWYKNNRERHKSRSAINKAAAKQEFLNWKATLRCVVCGEEDPDVLDFHHFDPHPDNPKINTLLKNGSYTKARQEAEEKCWPICANDHRRLHKLEHEIAKLLRRRGSVNQRESDGGDHAPSEDMPTV